MSDLQALQNMFGNLQLNSNLLTIAFGIGIMTDFITGIAKGYKKDKKIYSSKLRDGGFKKAGMVVVALLSYGLSMLFNDKSLVIYNGTLAYYIYTEIVSILENLVAIDVELPMFLLKIIGSREDDKNE